MRAFGFAAIAVLLVATVVSFAATRSSGHAASAIVGGNSTGTGSSGITFPSTGADAVPSSATDSGRPASASPLPPAGTQATSRSAPASTTPRPPPTTPPVLMSTYGVRNVLYKFFDGFLYHRLSDVRSAVCPKYRYLYNGTYTINPKDYELQKWRSNSYTLYPGRAYVDIYVAATLRNPRTGSVGKTWNHTWVIVLQSKTYYVCGTRS